MNAQRRKEVGKLQVQIKEAQDKLATAVDQARAIWDKATEEIMGLVGSFGDDLEDIKGGIEAIRDEEQEYYDNMPEGLQNSERGETATNNVEQLETALNSMEELGTFFSELAEETLSTERMDELGEMPDKMGEASEALDEAQN
jgi:DNA repair exonuclease SbcCD ATPase subunit